MCEIVVVIDETSTPVPIRSISEKTYVKIEYIDDIKARVYSRVQVPLNPTRSEVTGVVFYIEDNKHVIEAIKRWESRKNT